MKEPQIVERYTTVKIIILFVVVAMLAFVVIDILSRYEGEWFGKKKDLTGTNQELLDRAREYRDVEYCQNVEGGYTQEQCRVVAEDIPPVADDTQSIVEQARATRNPALCEQITDESQKNNCLRIAGG